MAKLTAHPNQLAFDFDAPIVAVVELRPSRPPIGTPVRFEWGVVEQVIEIVTEDGHSIGYSLTDYTALTRLLSRMDVSIDAVLGQDLGHGVFEVVLHRDGPEGHFRNIVRGFYAAGDTQLAA